MSAPLHKSIMQIIQLNQNNPERVTISQSVMYTGWKMNACAVQVWVIILLNPGPCRASIMSELRNLQYVLQLSGIYWIIYVLLQLLNWPINSTPVNHFCFLVMKVSKKCVNWVLWVPVTTLHESSEKWSQYGVWGMVMGSPEAFEIH